MTYRLVDTNIVSFQMKGSPLFALYQPHSRGFQLAVSFQTVAELWAGAEMAVWGAVRRLGLETTISGFVVLHSDDYLCRKYAEVKAARKHRTIPVGDAWIAATALAYDLEFVTHNPADFVDIPGLSIITEAH